MDELENYPRFRNDNIGMKDFIDVKGYEQGRSDLLARRAMGISRMAKALCATNHIRNPMPLRDSVRLYNECIYNELYLQGYRGDELEREYNNVMNSIDETSTLWRYYNNLDDGVITELGFGKMLGIPPLESLLSWTKTYDKTLR